MAPELDPPHPPTKRSSTPARPTAHEEEAWNLKATPEKTLTGFVSFIYRCPPCPKGAVCKPCMRPNIVLSRAPEERINYNNLGNDNVVVFVGSVSNFELGTQKTLELVDLRSKGVSWEATLKNN